MKSFKIAGAQGEVNIRRVNKLPEGINIVAAENKLLIVGHSESGHHHGFRDDGSVILMEKTKDVPAGMKIFYAIVSKEALLIQDTTKPHEPIVHEPGLYEFRTSREHKELRNAAFRVAD